MEQLEKPKQINPIPASIVKAICTVQDAMQAVKKSQKNQFGGYMYASADDIYAALSLKMAEAGLVSFCLEEGEPEVKMVSRETVDKKGEKVTATKQWLKVTYTFILATEQDTWTDPRAKRSLYIEITGPQTFQAAQSYAEKSWLRSMFKIATGDMDLDGLMQEGEEGEEPKRGRKRGRPKAEVVTPANGANKKPLPPLVGGEAILGNNNLIFRNKVGDG